MSEEMKLLTALCEALGFDIEITTNYHEREVDQGCGEAFLRSEMHNTFNEFTLKQHAGKFTRGNNGTYFKLLKKPVCNYNITKRGVAESVIKTSTDVHSFIEANKKHLSGAQISFYEIGTWNVKDSFSDYKELLVNTTPVIADANGCFPEIWIRKPYHVNLADIRENILFDKDYH